MGATPDPVLALPASSPAGANPVPARARWSPRAAHERGLSNSDRASRCRPPIRSTDSRTRHASTHRGRAIPTQRAKRSRTPPMATPPTSMRTITVRSARWLHSTWSERRSGRRRRVVDRRTLRPFATPDGPLRRFGGFADVLEALARTEPARERRSRWGTTSGRGGTRCLARARTPRSRCTRGRLDRTLRRPVRRRDRRRSRRSGRADCGGPTGRRNRPFSPPTRDTVPSNRTQSDDRNGEAAIATRDADLGATVEASLANRRPARLTRTRRWLPTPALPSSTTSGHRRGYLRYDPDVDESAIIAAVRGVPMIDARRSGRTTRTRPHRAGAQPGQHRRDVDDRRARR